MADWTKSMQQTFEYFTVDPGTWKDVDEITSVITSSISRDRGVATLGSASIEVTEPLGECYIRTYLVVNQNGVTERFPLGTHLVQTPGTSFNGKYNSYKLDAYTPLIELGEKRPPIGYSLLKDTDIMSNVFKNARENLRAPVVRPDCDEKLPADFVASPDETWLSFLTDLSKTAKFSFDLDEKGQVMFAPDQDTASLQPVWTFNDDNCSILYPDFTISRDLYGIPNVVEVVYSVGGKNLYARVTNNSTKSQTSTVKRGREIVHRITNPSLSGIPTKKMLETYATQALRELSTIEYKISYKHGYCPVRIGDCVLFNHKGAGLDNIKAKVISQNIECRPGCPVTETAVFTEKLWG